MVNTEGTGKGGDIDLHADTLLMKSGSTLWSSSAEVQATEERSE